MKLQKSLKRLLGMAVIASLAACSTHTLVQPSSTYDVGSKPGKGTVVMSVSRTGLYDVPLTFLYRKAGSSGLSITQISLFHGYEYVIDKPKTTDIVKSYNKRYGNFSDDNHKESFHVFELPAGQYEIYGMFLEDDFHQATWNSVSNFNLKFDVNAAKATYIGNIGLKTKSIGNSLLAVESVLSRNDRIEEDKKVLAELFPSINPKNFVKGAYLSKGDKLNVISRHYGVPKDTGNSRSD